MTKPSSKMLTTINQLSIMQLNKIRKAVQTTLSREENEFMKLDNDTIYGLGVTIEQIESALNTLKRTNAQAIDEYRRINELN